MNVSRASLVISEPDDAIPDIGFNFDGTPLPSQNLFALSFPYAEIKSSIARGHESNVADLTFEIWTPAPTMSKVQGQQSGYGTPTHGC